MKYFSFLSISIKNSHVFCDIYLKRFRKPLVFSPFVNILTIVLGQSESF